MKKALLPLIASCIFNFSHAKAQCAAPTAGVSTANLVVHVPFTNGQPTDVSFYAHPVSFSGSTMATDRFNNNTKAVTFTGTGGSGGVIPSNGYMVATNQITIAAWVKSNNISLPQRIVDKLAGTASGNFMVDLYQSKIRFFVSSAIVNPTTVLSSNTWYFIVCTYDGVSAKVYLNNSLIATTALTSNLTSNTNPFLIGKDQNSANSFNGTIDDVKYYNRTLTAQEISDLYEEPGFATHPLSYSICGGTNTGSFLASASSFAGPVTYKWKKAGNYLSDDAIYSGTNSSTLNLVNATPSEAGQYIVETYSTNCFMTTSDTINVAYSTPTNPDKTGLIVHYPFNDLTGQDFSGNNLTATMGTGMTITTDQNNVQGGAVDLTGFTNGYTTVAHNSLFNLTNQVTISFWVYLGNVVSSNTLIDKLPGATTNNIFIDLLNNNVRFFCAGGSVTSAAPIAMNSWSHIACKYDGSIIEIYINGSLSNSIAYTGTFTPNTSPLIIGAKQNTNNRFTGKLNDLRIYSRALSMSEILMDKSYADVLRQPISVASCIGENIKLTTTVSSDSPVAYQWLKNGVALSNGANISGATNDTLYITNVQTTDMGDYSCKFSNAICTPYSTDTITISNIGLVNISNSNLVMYFPMSNNLGNDMSGNGLNMTTMLNNTATSDKDAHVNEAINLTGTSSQMNVPSNPLMYKSNSNFTFSIWINPTTSGNQRIIEKGNSYLIDIYLGKIRLLANGFNLISNYNVLPNTWQHITCTSDGYTFKIYINGNLDITHYYPSGVYVAPANDQFLFGVTLYPVSGNFYRFAGAMDEFRFYTRVLSNDEIKGLYFAASQTSLPSSAILCKGTNNTLAVNAIASGTPNYQWYYNGSAIIGATQNNYSINGLNNTNAGAYICEITSSCAVINTDTAMVNLSSIDVSTSVSGATITAANISGNSFQWLDCNNAYAAMTGNTSLDFTAAANGSYAVQVTSNGCVDTSACTTISTVGIEEFSNSSINVSPNPASSFIQLNIASINSAVTIQIVDLSGRVLTQQITTKPITTFDITDFSSGVYFIRLMNGNKLSIQKFVKE